MTKVFMPEWIEVTLENNEGGAEVITYTLDSKDSAELEESVPRFIMRVRDTAENDYRGYKVTEIVWHSADHGELYTEIIY